jgi:hypothetical protein
MAKDEDAKRRIIEELEATRLELAGAASLVRRQLDIQGRVSASFRRHSWGWLSLAGILGWILARLPWRRKKISLEDGGRRRLKEGPRQADRKRDLAWMIWDGVWSLARPLLTAYLGRKLAQTTGISSSRKG